MNVIFLDIDGVMNSQDMYIRESNTFKRKLRSKWLWLKYTPRWIFTGSRSKVYSLVNYKAPAYTKTFEYTYKRLVEGTDKKKWLWLSEFCNRTGTKICISSCWKWHFSGDPELNDEGWSKSFDKLGFINDTFVGITGKRQTLRGDEIKNWILKEGDIERYAIIDDDSDMLPEQMGSFFHVDGYYGLSPNTLYRIGRHFGKPEDC
jgi:hypothetical protein